jgi:hypothetical protein
MPHSRKAQYVTAHGWLSEDGVLDAQAAWLAAFDRNTPPRLTMREAKLTVAYLLKAGHSRVHIAERLGISHEHATKLMTNVKKEQCVESSE